MAISKQAVMMDNLEDMAIAIDLLAKEEDQELRGHVNSAFGAIDEGNPILVQFHLIQACRLMGDPQAWKTVEENGSK